MITHIIKNNKNLKSHTGLKPKSLYKKQPSTLNHLN